MTREARRHRSEDHLPGANAGFDVVIVGGGAAGCVAAAHIAESERVSVLLLEAGPDLRADTPPTFRDGWRIPSGHDWGYTAEPDDSGVVEDLTRGRVLGGTSWMTRFALRGSSADYDEWDALGNAGWSFDEVLPWFTSLEADADFGDRPWHGADGPLPISRYVDLELSQIAAAGLEALRAQGFPMVDDHNQPGAVGAGRMPMSSRDGTRVTTADAFLPLDQTPENLTIRADAQVAEVVLDQAKAIGVRLLDDTVVEAGWVVLCAGTYGTPSILLRSGIGPVDHLRALEVPVRVALPGVGANLADHRGVDIDCGFRGFARSEPLLHLLATFHSAATSGDEAPDLALWLSDPRGDPAIFEIDVVLLRPRSRGTVRLRSADPAEPPVVTLPGLRDPSDLTRLVEGYERGLDVAARPEIRRLCAAPPAPNIHATDEVQGMVRAENYSFPHVVGTCSMGPRPDDGAVVDTSGRVHGVERLSVIDASIVPNGPSGFTHIPTAMIALRLSDKTPALM